MTFNSDAVLSRHSVDDPRLRNEFTTTLPIANRNEPSNSSELDLDPRASLRSQTSRSFSWKVTSISFLGESDGWWAPAISLQTDQTGDDDEQRLDLPALITKRKPLFYNYNSHIMLESKRNR